MRIPIILYHDIKEDNFDLTYVKDEIRPYILKKSNFIKQMEWLSNNGYRVIKLGELVNEFTHDVDRTPANTDPWIEKGDNKTICLVFDDGWISNYEVVYPILKGYGFKTTFFITVENIGKKDMVDWQQIKELAAAGMEIGSHGFTHRIPLELSNSELKYELYESKKVLEENLGCKIKFFSSPTGFYDRRIRHLAQQFGYQGVCFSKSALTTLSLHKDSFPIANKIGIKRDCNLELFIDIVSAKKKTLKALRRRQIFRDMVKTLLGVKKYNSIKSFILKEAV